ncbi:hypothetical protein LB505_002799 [Fusarium chuoi]|nr:hypothetical protein LB505_002799 [Fusarium chuoi]
MSTEQRPTGDALITSEDPNHPANLIPSLCAKFWTLGWVTGTGGGCSIRDETPISMSWLFLSKILTTTSSTSALICDLLPATNLLSAPPCSLLLSPAEELAVVYILTLNGLFLSPSC